MIVEASLQLPVIRDLKNAVEPDFSPNDGFDQFSRDTRRPIGIDSAENDMGGHRPRCIRECGEGMEIRPPQLIERRFHDRQIAVAIDPGPAVPRNMFDDRNDASIEKAFKRSTAKFGDQIGFGRKGPVANDVVAAGDRYVEDGGAIDIDPERT